MAKLEITPGPTISGPHEIVFPCPSCQADLSVDVSALVGTARTLLGALEALYETVA